MKNKNKIASKLFVICLSELIEKIIFLFCSQWHFLKKDSNVTLFIAYFPDHTPGQRPPCRSQSTGGFPAEDRWPLWWLGPI